MTVREDDKREVTPREVTPRAVMPRERQRRERGHDEREATQREVRGYGENTVIAREWGDSEQSEWDRPNTHKWSVRRPEMHKGLCIVATFPPQVVINCYLIN